MHNIIKDLVKKGIMTKDNVKIDSRVINPGDVFFALDGTEVNGHDFVRKAFENGAGYAVCKKNREEELKGINDNIFYVSDTAEALGDALYCVYENIFRDFFVYAVTGTNGKTTTTFMIKHFLNIAGYDAGLVGTVFVNTSGEMVEKAKMTTPDILSIYKYLAEMKKNEKDSAIIEVSSHALHQKRIAGIKLDSAVFTNITPEHLDYHKDMHSYLTDKVRIFDYLKEDGTSVFNIDDPMISDVVASNEYNTPVTFAIEKEADITASNICITAEGTRFDIKVKDRFSVDNVLLKLAGKHNVYNVLAAIACLWKKGLTETDIRTGIESFGSVPGRLDRVETGSAFKVFVDYAHTPNALENILNSVNELCEGEVICVFGCGGDRDKTKRPEMGKIAAELSDYVVLTNDNPRTEDPEEIIDQIEKGIRDNNNYCIIPDRYEAILFAVKKANPGDIVLIAGKGHEDYQLIGDKTIFFDDKVAAAAALKEAGF